MSRKKIIIEQLEKRLKPDPKFGNIIVTSFINQLMESGKKNVAQRIFYNAMDIAEKKLNKPAGEIFTKALENVKPVLEVRSRRVGGATYQVPVQVRQNRRNSLGIRWIIQSARERKGRSMIEKLSEEIMEAYKGEGPAVKKKDETHKMAEANKAFAHYRW